MFGQFLLIGSFLLSLASNADAVTWIGEWQVNNPAPCASCRDGFSHFASANTFEELPLPRGTLSGTGDTTREIGQGSISASSSAGGIFASRTVTFFRDFRLDDQSNVMLLGTLNGMQFFERFDNVPPELQLSTHMSVSASITAQIDISFQENLTGFPGSRLAEYNGAQFQDTDLLDPGLYRLNASVTFQGGTSRTLGTHFGGGISWAVGVTSSSTTVPEPSSILLLVSGLGWLVRRTHLKCEDHKHPFNSASR